MGSDKSIQIARSIADSIDPLTGELFVDEKVRSDHAPQAETIVESAENGDKNSDEKGLALEVAMETIRSFATGPKSQDSLEKSQIESQRTLEVLLALCRLVLARAEDDEQNRHQKHEFPSPDSNAPRGSTSLQEYLDEVEKREILAALEEVRFNRTQAARRLGITFRSMRYRMERLGLA